MNICILGTTFNNGNRGVGALTEGIMQCILKHFLTPNITLLNYGLTNDEMEFDYNGKKIRVRKANMRFSKKIFLRNNIAMLIIRALIIRLIPIKRLKKRLITKNIYLNILSKSDIVVSIAGGDSFSDIYGLQRFFYIALPQILSILMEKKIVQLPQTYGPFNHKLTEWIAKFILRNSSLIYSRDYLGIETIRNMINNGRAEPKVKFSYDVGFVVEGEAPSRAPLDIFSEKHKGLPLVGLNVSGLLYMGGYSKRNMFKLKVDYRDLIDLIIGTIITKWNAIVILIPHVFGVDNPNSENDQQVCYQIYNRLKLIYENRLFCPEGSYDHKEIKHIIGNCDFFVGSRMHACIAAISQNIPTVPIAYSSKFIGVMQTVGIDSFVADPTKMELNEVIQVMERAWKTKENTRNNLEVRMPEVKRNIYKIFDEFDAYR